MWPNIVDSDHQFAMKRLTIEPIGGLSNRLMAMDSAISFCSDNNYELHLIWPLFRGLNCKFEDLFERPDIITSISYPVEYSSNKFVSNIRVSTRKISRLVSRLKFDKILDKKAPELYTDELVISNSSTKYGGLDLDPQYSDVLIRTDRRFYYNPSPYSLFKPVEIVRQYVADACKTLPLKNSFGIHIRRTDNIWSIEHSPLSMFHELVQNIIREHPESYIYLATDSPEVETEFVSKYRDKIVTYNKPSLSRNKITGLHHALVEILLLSETRGITGSYGSSFSTVAAEMGNIPIEIIKKQD